MTSPTVGDEKFVTQEQFAKLIDDVLTLTGTMEKQIQELQGAILLHNDAGKDFAERLNIHSKAIAQLQAQLQRDFETFH